MTDLFRGETCTEAYNFISAGTAHTFQFNFEPDMVIFTNLTQWAATGANIPRSFWFRNPAAVIGPGRALQEQVVIDSGATGNANFLNASTNGFTFIDTPAGPVPFRALISGVTQANPCVVTTSAPNLYQTDQLVRITDLGDNQPVARGMSQLDGNRYGIIVLSATTFSLYDPITLLPIDSTNYEAWVSGGRVDLETRVISLNNPQVAPYNVVPYVPNPFVYNPETFQLLAGTAVMGANNDVYVIEVIKWGQLYNLGHL